MLLVFFWIVRLLLHLKCYKEGRRIKKAQMALSKDGVSYLYTGKYKYGVFYPLIIKKQEDNAHLG